jgi:hypothetical protein
VNADQAWCTRLSIDDPRIETVNMGQGGYGIDQAYLWYRRDGLRLDHQAQIFAYIFADIERMASDDFSGYPKPAIHTGEHGELVIENVPVPHSSLHSPWLQRHLPVIFGLKSSELIRTLVFGEPEGPLAANNRFPHDPELYATVLEIFEELRRIHAQRGSTLVLVYLPTTLDLTADRNEAIVWRHYREQLGAELSRRGFAYFDLTPEAAALSPSDQAAMFRLEDQHYTPAGNERVSRWIAERLRSTPALAERLGASPAPHP